MTDGKVRTAGDPSVIRIYVDADACPVKEEIFRVAKRYGLRVFVVSNGRIRTPPDPAVEMIVVTGRFDAADDWIAERVTPTDIAVTSDIPLASRCIASGARVLDPKGKVFTPESIGDAVANRELMAYLRESGSITGGPAPFEARDRSRFLQKLDDLIQALLKASR
ncbi:MAG: YaiI/YqxD family protein [Holophagales bacterium]|nr:YaiI/YqxD family protein [Holophagales bacterium]